MNTAKAYKDQDNGSDAPTDKARRAHPAAPASFRRWAAPVRRFAWGLAAILIAAGLYLGLVASPPDYQQSDTVRIMYIHVPAAWLSLFIYATLCAGALSYLVLGHMLAGLFLRAAAPAGVAFTALCLITGALWGKPMWGAWWVWDARLTSVLILFFVYIGIVALTNAFQTRDKGMIAASWLTLIGAVNLPVIKFSVEWWNTLHQPASLTSLSRMSDPAIAPEMLWPLLVMASGLTALFVAIALLRLENQILERKIYSPRSTGHRREDT